MQQLFGDATDLYLAVAFFLGVVASYTFHRMTYISLGGLISVGYLAGALVEPLDVVATLVLSLVSYWVLYNVVLRFVVLSNRRTFELGVATGRPSAWASSSCSRTCSRGAGSTGGP